jgi:hypothetical protein
VPKEAWTAGAITSTEIHEVSFPRPGSVISRGFTHVGAVHGIEELGILVGGTVAIT